jgi:hypothetical protein
MSSTFQWCFSEKTGLFGWKNPNCIHANSMQSIYFAFHIHEHNMKKSFYQYGTCLYVFTGFAPQLHSGVYVSGHFNRIVILGSKPHEHIHMLIKRPFFLLKYYKIHQFYRTKSIKKLTYVKLQGITLFFLDLIPFGTPHQTNTIKTDKTDLKLGSICEKMYILCFVFLK